MFFVNIIRQFNCLLIGHQVNESHCGREHVVPSIVQFGFLLLESVEEGNYKEYLDSNGLLGFEELGIQILKTLFDVHDMTRNEVGGKIQQIAIS